MREKIYLLMIGYFTIANPTLFAADEKISLECIGVAEEIIWNGQKILDRRIHENIVIYYELDKKSVTEHMSTLSLTQERIDIEKKSDNIFERSGYYRFEESEIAFSKITRFKGGDEFTSRAFQINRKTGAWRVDASISGGYWGAVYGKDVKKNTAYNGQCRPWNAKNKF
jgi:hypothetical protein